MPFESLEGAQEAAARLAAVANLEAIILRELHWTFPENAIPGGLPISIGAGFALQVGKMEGNIPYRVSAELAGSVPDHGEFFRLDITYQLVYSVPEVEEFGELELEGFGSTTVLLMAFPYIRQALQDMGGRAGLPSVLLAPLRLPFGDHDAQAPSPQ